MTDTQMVMVPKVLNTEMYDAGSAAIIDGFRKHDDLYDAMIQASPNKGKVTPEMVEELAGAYEMLMDPGTKSPALAMEIALSNVLGLEVAG